VEAVAHGLRQVAHDRRLIADSYLDDGWMRTLMAAAGQTQAPRVDHIEALIDRLGVVDAEVRRRVALVDRQGLARHRPGPDARWLAVLIAVLTDSHRASASELPSRPGGDRARAKAFEISTEHVA